MGQVQVSVTLIIEAIVMPYLVGQLRTKFLAYIYIRFNQNLGKILINAKIEAIKQ